jgi:hypothetical protein
MQNHDQDEHRDARASAPSNRTKLRTLKARQERLVALVEAGKGNAGGLLDWILAIGEELDAREQMEGARVSIQGEEVAAARAWRLHYRAKQRGNNARAALLLHLHRAAVANLAAAQERLRTASAWLDELASRKNVIALQGRARKAKARATQRARDGWSEKAARRRKVLKYEVGRLIKTYGWSDRMIERQLRDNGRPTDRGTIRRLREELGYTPQQVKEIAADLG